MCLKCIPVFLRVLLFHALCVLEHITHRLESGQSCKITPALCSAVGRVSVPGLQWPPPAYASEELELCSGKLNRAHCLVQQCSDLGSKQNGMFYLC